MTARRLIISADDFGLGAAVDRGIAAAVAAGSVTSVGVIANLAEPARVAELAARHPGLSLGVHLNLTTGRPVRPPSAVRSLVDSDGAFLPFSLLARRALAGGVDRAHVTDELRAQLARLEAAGIRPDHLDSHEHVHLVPGVTGAAVRLARSAGLAMRTHRPVVLPTTRRRLGAFYARHPRRIVTHAVKHLIALRLRRAGIATPDGMVASSLLVDGPPGGPLAEWTAVAAALPAGTWELVVHPADLAVQRTPTEAAWLGELVERRGAELAALLDPRFSATLAACGVMRVSFAALMGHATGRVVARTRYA